MAGYKLQYGDDEKKIDSGDQRAWWLIDIISRSWLKAPSCWGEDDSKWQAVAHSTLASCSADSSSFISPPLTCFSQVLNYFLLRLYLSPDIAVWNCCSKTNLTCAKGCLCLENLNGLIKTLPAAAWPPLTSHHSLSNFGRQIVTWFWWALKLT